MSLEEEKLNRNLHSENALKSCGMIDVYTDNIDKCLKSFKLKHPDFKENQTLNIIALSAKEVKSIAHELAYELLLDKDAKEQPPLLGSVRPSY